ncbi:MAG: hypothetical protein CBD16_01905 [Betaproteobacteria bacterium TMED156]|nr:MAG: hypothetical protein CBD16_01905 [Betaproteobacteria bacterium TMED156]
MNKNKLTAALKRKALAAAVMVAVSGSALADVTIYGIMDLSIGGNSGDNDALVLSGGETNAAELPSIWGIKGSEDLGGGLTASFALESDFNSSDGNDDRLGNNIFWNRQSNITLSNDLGSITAGRIYSPAILTVLVTDPRQLYEWQSGLIQYATLASTTNTNTFGDVFLANAIQFKFGADGLSAAVAYGFGEAAGDQEQNSNFHMGVSYSGGPLTIGGTYLKNKGNSVDSSQGEDEKSSIGLKYSMGDIAIAGHYMKGEANDATGVQTTDNEGYAVGLIWKSGNNEFDVAYYGTKNEIANTTDNENDEIILAYRNNLSKRTTLYAKLCAADRGTNAPAGACIGNAGENDTFYNFGLIHKF